MSTVETVLHLAHLGLSVGIVAMCAVAYVKYYRRTPTNPS